MEKKLLKIQKQEYTFHFKGTATRNKIGMQTDELK